MNGEHWIYWHRGQFLHEQEMREKRKKKNYIPLCQRENKGETNVKSADTNETKTKKKYMNRIIDKRT